MNDIKITILTLLSLIILVSLVSGATYSGDWSYLLDDPAVGTATTTGGTIRVADQQVAAAETQAQGTYSDWVYLENDTFQISVSLISNEILCELDPDYPNTGGGSGYLTLPGNAIMAKTLTGRVDWQRSESMSPAERYLRGTVHILSYTLDDTPTPTATPTQDPNSTVNMTQITQERIERESFVIPLSIYSVLAVMVFVCLLYALYDTNNRIYGNIIAGGVGSLMAFLVANLSLNGSVAAYIGPVQTGLYVVNNTTSYMEYTEFVSPMVSGSIGWFFAFLGVVMAILCIILIVEAYMEREDDDEF